MGLGYYLEEKCREIKRKLLLCVPKAIGLNYFFVSSLG